MASRRASQALWPKVPKGAGVSSLEPSSTSIEVRLGVGTGTAQAPTCVWTSRKGGKIFLAGLPIQQTVRKFPTMALQICCFPHGPETAAYSYERSEQWTDVWPAVKNTVWNGDNVLIHCIKGRHRGAFLAVLCRALLAGESTETANKYIEARRGTELHKVLKDQGKGKWLQKARQETVVGTMHPEPQGFAATDKSSTHVIVDLVPTHAGRREGKAPCQPVHRHRCLRGLGMGASLL